MFGHVAVAVDFSPAMDPMLRCLSGLRELGTRKLTFVHVARLESPIAGWVAHLEYYEQKLRDEICPPLQQAGFETHIVVVAGEPAEEIVRVARERDASLVLVGSRGSNALPGGFLGSVAWEVVQRAVTPVLVQRVEPGPHDASTPFSPCCGPLSRVLFPTDFSDPSESAFAYVEALARAGVGQFVLLHVRAEEPPSPEARTKLAEDRLRLEALADRLRAAGARQVAVELPSGDPVDELLHLAARYENSLLVLGTHGRGWLAELMTGSVSHDLVQRVHASVLLVRIPAADPVPVRESSTPTKPRR